MAKLHNAIKPFLIGGVLLCACLLGGARSAARAQQTPPVVSETRERGVKLYRQGDFKAAIQAMRAAIKEQKDDAEAWHYLGLSLQRTGDAKAARKAFERAVKIKPELVVARTAWAYMLLLANKNSDAAREAERALASDARNADAQYILAVVNSRAGAFAKALEKTEASLALNPDFAPALLLKGQVLISLFMGETNPSNTEPLKNRFEHLKGAAESLEKYLQLTPKAKDAAFWREQLESLRAYKELADESKTEFERSIFWSRETTTRARILSRAEPTYTEAARQAQVSGTVVLRAIFAADGIVKNILVVRSLSNGLTEQAVAAARKIKFIPAVRNGRPVSQFIQIEYNFNLY